jgi:hypothetical protein
MAVDFPYSALKAPVGSPLPRTPAGVERLPLQSTKCKNKYRLTEPKIKNDSSVLKKGRKNRFRGTTFIDAMHPLQPVTRGTAHVCISSC